MKTVVAIVGAALWAILWFPLVAGVWCAIRIADWIVEGNWIAIVFVFMTCCCRAQMPPAMAMHTNYYAARAVCGTNYSKWSNEVSTTNAVTSFTWTNITPGLAYQIGMGFHSGQYVSITDVGTNEFTVWPLPRPPLVTSIAWGGQPFLSFTGAAPAPAAYFRAYPATDSPWVSISDAPDLTGSNWNSAFAFVNTTNTGFTFSLSNIPH